MRRRYGKPANVRLFPDYETPFPFSGSVGGVTIAVGK